MTTWANHRRVRSTRNCIYADTRPEVLLVETGHRVVFMAGSAMVVDGGMTAGLGVGFFGQF